MLADYLVSRYCEVMRNCQQRLRLTTPTKHTTPEEFELELRELELSGRRFGPTEYAKALEVQLDISICFRLLDSVANRDFILELLASGVVARTVYDAEKRLALIMIPDSLPEREFAVTAYHELSHLAVGDHLLRAGRRRQNRRGGLGGRQAMNTVEEREREADLRAIYAFSAGALGAENPYASNLEELLQ